MMLLFSYFGVLFCFSSYCVKCIIFLKSLQALRVHHQSMARGKLSVLPSQAIDEGGGVEGT